MKTEGAIAQKAKQLRFRHMKRELTRLLKPGPRNCKNNAVVDSAAGPLGVCRLDCKTCDETIADRSSSCGKFESLHTKEQIKESLINFFETRPPQDVAVRFPDVAALQWVIEEEARPLFPNSIPAGTWFGIPFWVDTEAEFKFITDAIGDLKASHDLVTRLSVLLDVPVSDVVRAVEGKLFDLIRVEGERKRVQEKLNETTSRLDAAEAMMALKVRIPAAAPAPSIWQRIRSWWS